MAQTVDKLAVAALRRVHNSDSPVPLLVFAGGRIAHRTHFESTNSEPARRRATNISKDKVVAFNYTLKDDAGSVLDSSEGRDALVYLHGAGNIIPGLEAGLEGKATGDQVAVVVAPEDAYGQRDDALVGQVPRENLAEIEDLQVGTQLEAHTPEGVRVVHVIGIDDDNVTVDANHPLAGVTLHFDLTVVDVRDATQEELDHGHPHGADDHEH